MLTLLLLPLTCLMLSPSLAQEPPIPAHMLGKFQLETSKGFDDFMYEINVGWFTRKIACTLYPTATNSITSDGQIQIDTSSTFKSSSIKFRLNEPFPETTSDGRKVKTTAVLYGNRLIKDQKHPTDSTLDVVETRQFSPDGQFMTLIHTMPKRPKIKSVRVYKRL